MIHEIQTSWEGAVAADMGSAIARGGVSGALRAAANAAAMGSLGSFNDGRPAFTAGRQGPA